MTAIASTMSIVVDDFKMQEAALSVHWDTAVLSGVDFSVFLDDALDLWLVLVDATNHRAMLSADTWDALHSHQAAANLFNAVVKKLPSGLCSIDTSIEPYRTAAASAAATYGIGLANDRVNELADRLRTLLTRAIAPEQVDPATMLALTLGYTQARARMTELEAEMDQARVLLELVGDAIVDR